MSDDERASLRIKRTASRELRVRVIEFHGERRLEIALWRRRGDGDWFREPLNSATLRDGDLREVGRELLEIADRGGLAFVARERVFDAPDRAQFAVACEVIEAQALETMIEAFLRKLDLTERELATATGWPLDLAESTLARLVATGAVVRVGAGFRVFVTMPNAAQS